MQGLIFVSVGRWKAKAHYTKLGVDVGDHQYFAFVK